MDLRAALRHEQVQGTACAVHRAEVPIFSRPTDEEKGTDSLARFVGIGKGEMVSSQKRGNLN